MSNRCDQLQEARQIRAAFRLSVPLDARMDTMHRRIADAEAAARHAMGPKLCALLDEAETHPPFSPGWYGHRPNVFVRWLSKWGFC